MRAHFGLAQRRRVVRLGGIGFVVPCSRRANLPLSTWLLPWALSRWSSLFPCWSELERAAPLFVLAQIAPHMLLVAATPAMHCSIYSCFDVWWSCCQIQPCLTRRDKRASKRRCCSRCSCCAWYCFCSRPVCYTPGRSCRARPPKGVVSWRRFPIRLERRSKLSNRTY